MFNTVCPDCLGRKGRRATTCVPCMYVRRAEVHRNKVLGLK